MLKGCGLRPDGAECWKGGCGWGGRGRCRVDEEILLRQYMGKRENSLSMINCFRMAFYHAPIECRWGIGSTDNENNGSDQSNFHLTCTEQSINAFAVCPAIRKDWHRPVSIPVNLPRRKHNSHSPMPHSIHPICHPGVRPETGRVEW